MRLWFTSGKGRLKLWGTRGLSFHWDREWGRGGGGSRDPVECAWVMWCGNLTLADCPRTLTIDSPGVLSLSLVHLAKGLHPLSLRDFCMDLKYQSNVTAEHHKDYANQSQLPGCSHDNLLSVLQTFPPPPATSTSKGSQGLEVRKEYVLCSPLDEILRLGPNGGFGELLQQFRQLRGDAYLLICLRHWLIDLLSEEK